MMSSFWILWIGYIDKREKLISYIKYVAKNVLNLLFELKMLFWPRTNFEIEWNCDLLNYCFINFFKNIISFKLFCTNHDFHSRKEIVRKQFGKLSKISEKSWSIQKKNSEYFRNYKLAFRKCLNEFNYIPKKIKYIQSSSEIFQKPFAFRKSPSNCIQ